MMTERGRLGLLEMGVRRYNRLGVGFGYLGDAVGELIELLHTLIPCPVQIETKIECDLVVSRAPGV